MGLIGVRLRIFTTLTSGVIKVSQDLYTNTTVPGGQRSMNLNQDLVQLKTMYF